MSNKVDFYTAGINKYIYYAQKTLGFYIFAILISPVMMPVIISEGISVGSIVALLLGICCFLELFHYTSALIKDTCLEAQYYFDETGITKIHKTRKQILRWDEASDLYGGYLDYKFKFIFKKLNPLTLVSSSGEEMTLLSALEVCRKEETEECIDALLRFNGPESVISQRIEGKKKEEEEFRNRHMPTGLFILFHLFLLAAYICCCFSFYLNGKFILGSSFIAVLFVLFLIIVYHDRYFSKEDRE